MSDVATNLVSGCEAFPPVAPTVPADVKAGADAATLAKAAQLAEARMEANKTLEQCVVSFRAGESAMRNGRFEAGRLADTYVRQRLALGDKRDASIQTVEGELSKWASEKVDGNVLIRCYHAWRLLTDQSAITDSSAVAVPYGHYVHSFATMIERTDKDTANESWRLFPGFEDRSRALFLECGVNTLSRDACKDKVRALMVDVAASQAKDAAAMKIVFDQKAAEQKNAADAAKKDADAAEKAARDAKVLADAAKEEEKAALTAAWQKSEAERIAKQTAAAQLAQKAIDAQKDASRAASVQKQADKTAQKAVERVEPRVSSREGATVSKAAPAPEPYDPIAAAKKSTAKDLAAQLVKMMNAHQSPRAVLEEFARLLRWSQKDGLAFARGLLDSTSKGATDAAIALAVAIHDALAEEGATLEQDAEKEGALVGAA